MSGDGLAAEDPLRAWTPARVGLGRSGGSLPTRHRLQFQLDHARARDAVHGVLDLDALARDLGGHGAAVVPATTRCRTREEYLLRPDLGRRLDPASAARLLAPPGGVDLVVVVGGGLSPVAVQRHGPALLGPVVDTLLRLHWSLGPLVLVGDGRVALADEVGEIVGARLSLIVIGERPGLTAPYSLGAYVTVAPRVGRTDAERRCLSNIRPGGLDPADAAGAVVALLEGCRATGSSGVALAPRPASPRLLDPVERPAPPGPA